jgi:hypothetical protein
MPSCICPAERSPCIRYLFTISDLLSVVGDTGPCESSAFIEDTFPRNSLIFCTSGIE